MNEDFFGERKGNVVLRKAGSEQSAKKIKPEDGLIAGDILEKLRKEAKQLKEEEKAEIAAEKKRLDDIFAKKELN